MNKLFTMAVIALLACGSANAQNMLGRLANRAKDAAENAVGKKIENAVYKAVDKAVSKEAETVVGKNQQKQSAAEQGTPAVSVAPAGQAAPARPVAPAAAPAPAEPVAAAAPSAPVAVRKAPVPVTDPIPGAVSFKYTNGKGSGSLYYVYTRAEGRSRSDRFEEGEELNENDVMEKYSYHDVMLLPKRGETPVKYEDKRWTESYAAMQELSIMWQALVNDCSEFYVQKDGFKEAGTAVVCGKTCTKYTGTIKTMGGYDLFTLNGSSAEIYTWNGYTMKLVMNGKVVYEVVGYTELVPESAFTRTLDVNWI